MNKAMVFPIRKKWVDMIFELIKTIELRNKKPKDLVTGMKIYFYEALGKKIEGKGYKDLSSKDTEGNITYHGQVWQDDIHEGTGKIVGEATVGEISRILNTCDHNQLSIMKSTKLEDVKKATHVFRKDFEQQGYTDQKYAIELTNVIKYDEEWIARSIMSPLEKEATEEALGRNNLAKKLLDYDNNLLNAPTSPIAKEEFVSWNKLQEAKLKDSEMELKTLLNCVKQVRINYPPQAPIYVVEREVK